MTTATTDSTKRELLDALHAARQGILDSLANVPPDRFDEAALADWSILDLLAHLVGWDFTYLKAIPEIQSGQLPNFFTYWDKDWRSYNALLLNLYKQPDPIEQVAALQDSYARLIELLETIPAADFGKDFGVRFKGSKVTIDGLLSSETEDEHTHAAQIASYAASLPR